MEFKGRSCMLLISSVFVDIGTEWNLKLLQVWHVALLVMVDIGTEWNLKKINMPKSA